MATRKAAAARKERAPSQALDGPAESEAPADLVAAANALIEFPDLYERWRNKRITDDEYFSRRGCFKDCEIVHDHYAPADGVPALLVEYIGEWPIVTHDRHDASRSQPVNVFASNAGPVKITDPYDKYRYLRNALANPTAWHVRWDGSAVDAWLTGPPPDTTPQMVPKSAASQRAIAAGGNA